VSHRGEALALRYAAHAGGKPPLDLDARAWEVNATIARLRRGLWNLCG
jgi:hypothetical protein